jgi:hypothetical protein
MPVSLAWLEITLLAGRAERITRAVVRRCTDVNGLKGHETLGG